MHAERNISQLACEQPLHGSNTTAEGPEPKRNEREEFVYKS